MWKKLQRPAVAALSFFYLGGCGQWPGAARPGGSITGELLPWLLLFVLLLAAVLVAAAALAQNNRLLRTMRDNERHYRRIAEAATDGIVAIGSHGRILYANPAAGRIFGYDAGELLGRELAMLVPERLQHVHKRAFAQYLASSRDRPPYGSIEIPGMRKDGREIALEISFGESRRSGDRLFIGIIRDVTERKLAEESRHWLAAIVESSNDAIIGKTLGGNVLSWNRAAERIYGYSAAEMMGRSISIVVPPEYMEELREILDSVSRGGHIRHHETERIRKDGTRIHVSLTISPIRDEHGTILGASAISRDITERKRTEERLRHLAQHDALTGLPNRMLCYDRVGQAILRARRDGDQVAVLFLDLDGFKQINDTQGHEIGDEILRTVARRLQHCLREGDTVARLGGDEFVICLPALKEGNAAASIADKVLEALCAPIGIGGNQLQVTCSIGISLYPRDGEDTQALLRAADMAMYHAKGMGRNRYRRAE